MKKVFSIRLANELVKMGFKILDFEINTNNPKLKVFIFEDTKEINYIIEKIKNKK